MPLKLKTLFGAASALALAAALSTTRTEVGAATEACAPVDYSRCVLYADRLQFENAMEEKYFFIGCLVAHGCDPYEGKKLALSEVADRSKS